MSEAIPLMKARGKDFYQVGKDELGELEFSQGGDALLPDEENVVFKAEEPPTDPLFIFRASLDRPPPAEANEYQTVFGGEHVRTGSQWHLRLKKKK